MPRRRHAPLSPRRRPRQTRSRATTAAILDAAARVFAAHGYAAGTTNRIAEEAGVSVGSLYEYYPNKDALLVALLDAHVREADDVLMGLAADVQARPAPLGRVVRRYVEAMIALHAHDPRLHRVLFEEAPLPPPTRRALAAVEERMVGQVAAFLRAHPEARVGDPVLAATLVVHAVEALTHRLVLYGRRDAQRDGQRQAWVREVTALVTRYVTGGSAGIA